MTPDYSISADGLCITERLQRYCTAITVIDEAGAHSDSATLTLANSDSQLPLPRMGSELTVSLGYQESGLMPMGIYLVDSVTVQSSPQTMTITSHAANLNSAFKSQRTRSWAPQPLGQLIDRIAQANGYEAKVSQALSSIPLPHLDQTAESDLHFLTRLASVYGAIAKPTNGYLIFAIQSVAQSMSGLTLPTVNVTPQDTQDWRMTFNQRQAQGCVIAEHHDRDRARTMAVTAGDQAPSHQLRQSFADPHTAQHAAESVLKRFSHSTATLAMTLVGNDKLRAETPIQLVGFSLSEALPTSWIVHRVEHQLTVSSRGFITRITAQVATQPSHLTSTVNSVSKENPHENLTA